MVRLKPIILVPILFAGLCVGLVLLPAILFLSKDLIGVFVNRSFSICEVMDRSRLETSLREGLKINDGCCVEHMIGECSIAYPNSSALIFAIENQSLDAVKLLLDHGADVNKSTESGNALSSAASQGNQEITEILLANGTNTDSHDTALRMAAHFGHTKIAKLILDRELPERRGESCAKLACSLIADLDQIGTPQLAQQKELFLYIISSCLDPNLSCEKAGRLLGYLAKKDDHAPLIEALLKHGADPNAKEENGKSVRDNLRAFADYDSRPKIKALIEEKAQAD